MFQEHGLDNYYGIKLIYWSLNDEEIFDYVLPLVQSHIESMQSTLQFTNYGQTNDPIWSAIRRPDMDLDKLRVCKFLLHSSKS